MTVRGDSIHVHESVHVVGDDELFVSKLFTKDLDGLQIVGRREGEPGNSIVGCAVKEGSQIAEFINIREVGVEMDSRLV